MTSTCARISRLTDVSLLLNSDSHGDDVFLVSLEMPTDNQYMLFVDAGWSRRQIGLDNQGERGPDPPFLR